MHIHSQHTLNIMNPSCFFIHTLTKWDEIHTLNNATLYSLYDTYVQCILYIYICGCKCVCDVFCTVHAYQSKPFKWINYKDFIKRTLCTVYIYTVCRLIVIVVNVLLFLSLFHTLSLFLFLFLAFMYIFSSFLFL